MNEKLGESIKCEVKLLLYDLLSAGFDSHEWLELQGGDSAWSAH